MGTDSWIRPQIGNENNLLLPAPENLEPGTHKIEGASRTEVVWPTCILEEFIAGWEIGGSPSNRYVASKFHGQHSIFHH